MAKQIFHVHGKHHIPFVAIFTALSKTSNPYLGIGPRDTLLLLVLSAGGVQPQDQGSPGTRHLWWVGMRLTIVVLGLYEGPDPSTPFRSCQANCRSHGSHVDEILNAIFTPAPWRFRSIDPHSALHHPVIWVVGFLFGTVSFFSSRCSDSRNQRNAR